jgi:gliding motility-associated-like protein
MKKMIIPHFLTLIFFCGVIFNSHAQSTTCDDATILLDVNNFCSAQKAYTNVGVTPSTFSLPSCWTNTAAKQDIWFKFTAVGTDVNVIVSGGNGVDGTIKKPNLALMTDCTGSTINEVNCTKGTKDTTGLYSGGLTPGKIYYIRVSSTTAAAGTFKICLDSYTPPLSPTADCDKAIKLCDKRQVHVPSLSGGGSNSSEPKGSCMKDGEHNSCWYYWVCDTAGTLTFDLIPGLPDTDMDFALFSAANAADICNSSTRKMERCSCTSCKFGATGLNSTSAPSDVNEAGNCTPGDDAYVYQLIMVPGTTYTLVVDNASTTDGFTINFGGTGTFLGAKAKITADKTSICVGESIKYTSTSVGKTIDWNFGSGNGTPSSGTGAGPFTVKYNTPGNYVAILKATDGCVSTDYVNITVNETPTITVTSDHICEGEEGALTAVASVPNGTFSWSPAPTSGGGTATIKASPVTDQTYTVTYALGGCSVTGMGKITVNKKPVVTVNSESACAGTSATLTATLKETTGTYTYLWSPDGEKTSSITKSPTAATVYTVTVTSAEGCLGIGTGTIDVNGTLAVNAGNDTTICSGATVNLKVKPNGTGYTYKWTSSSGTVSDPTIYNPAVTPIATTTYTVEVTSDKGCSGTDIITVSIDPLMSPALTPTAVTCNEACDGKVTTAVTGGTSPYTYSWTGGCTTPSCTALCPGTYTVTVNDKIGCTVQGDATITEPSAIALQTSFVNSTCGKPNGTATVIATGGTPGSDYTYVWDDPQKQTTATATGLFPKKYCVTVTDANGCKKTACMDVLDKPGITASLVSVSPASCNGLCDGVAEVTATGGSIPYSYSWNTVPGAQTSDKATGLCAGNYIATVTDATGCADTIQVKIAQPQPVTLDPVQMLTICIGSNAMIVAGPHGGNGNYMYDWTPESALTTPSILVSPVVSTDYHLVVKDGKGCASASMIIKVNVHPPLKVTGSNDVSLCIGDSTKLTAVGSGGNGGPYKYTWAPAVNGVPGNNLTVKPSANTTYTVTIKDDCGTPAAMDSIKVNMNASPVIKFGGDSLSGCTPVSTNFKDSSSVAGGGIISWKWDFGDGSQSDAKDPTHIFSTNGTTSLYSVTLTVQSNNNGCTSVLKKNKMIQVYPMPVPSFDAPLSTSIVNPVIHFTNNSVGVTSWEWNFGDTICAPLNNVSTQFSPNHTYSAIGKYCVNLLVQNGGGCKDSTFKCIDIDPQFVIFIPNAFTPNGDGDNDVFYAKGEYIHDFEMRIFDRWGNIIYYTDDINKPWNGKRNNAGEVEEQDVYVYQITIKDNKDKRHKYVGTVTLIKGG